MTDMLKLQSIYVHALRQPEHLTNENLSCLTDLHYTQMLRNFTNYRLN